MKRNALNIALQTEWCEYATYIKKEDFNKYNVGTFWHVFGQWKRIPNN